LQEWVQHRDRSLQYLPSPSARSYDGSETGNGREPFWHTWPVALGLLIVLYALLLTALFGLRGNENDPVATTYRTMVYAGLWAPLGALLRWHLSSWNNGKKSMPWTGTDWFPLGTFSANMIGCVVSIIAVAWEYRMEYQGHVQLSFWLVGTIRAIKVGFAGSLTTVSTFVSEVSGFMDRKTDHAYPYIWISLISSCVTGSAIYACIMYL
jgi:fluoride ion exporter CrcB/FEX